MASRGDVASVLVPIWIKKQETARRVLQRTKVVFDWAIVKGYRTAGNPVEGVKLALPRQKKEVEHFAAIPWLDPRRRSLDVILAHRDTLHSVAAAVDEALDLAAALGECRAIGSW